MKDIIQADAVDDCIGVYRKFGEIFFRRSLLFNQAAENRSDSNEGKKKYGEPNGTEESDGFAGTRLPVF